jgi:hypothetical protein
MVTRPFDETGVTWRDGIGETSQLLGFQVPVEISERGTTFHHVYGHSYWTSIGRIHQQGIWDDGSIYASMASAARRC